MGAICILGLSSMLLAGCATRSTEIAAPRVSPIQYQSYSCTQLREEAARVSSRAAIASGAQDQNATNDAVATGVALVLFWPAAFMVEGNSANGQEVSQLEGTWTQSIRRILRRDAASDSIGSRADIPTRLLASMRLFPMDKASPLPRWIPPQLCQLVETVPSGPQ
jgi:hypothetical protein